ncbi:MAG: VCBS repeat-containing protein [Candidatus Eisenbacteria sp.]|nr:VCBS repeat-containing protein [Candidatus Eisenbacteria bacterium]
MKRALVIGLLVGTIFPARAAVAQIDPGIHTAFAADNHLVIDGEGNFHLVYLGWDGSQLDVYHTLSSDEGFTWSTPENLSSTPDMGSAEPPDLAAGPNGDIAFVWSEGPEDSTSIYLLYEPVTGSTPVELAATGNWMSGPKVGISDDLVHILWYDERPDTTAMLGYIRYDTRVSYPPILETMFIGPSGGYAQWPSVSVDAGGTLHAVFSYSADLASEPPAPTDVFYMTSVDGGFSWSDTTRLSESGALSMFPHVVVDGDQGTVHVVWQEGEGADSEIHYISSDGTGCSAPENLSNTPGVASRYPTLSLDALGTLHLVWSDETDGDFDVYHRSYDGWSGWTTAENVSNSGESSLGTTQMEVLDGYGFIACWVEGNSAPYHIMTRSGFSEVLFTNVGEEAGLDQTGLSRGMGWADVDGDGLEDLVVLRWAFPGGRGSVFGNRGTTFELLEAFETPDLANSVAWADYDNDGFRDLAIAQWGGSTLLFHNAGGDSLVEVGSDAGVGGAFVGRALAWCDYDRDGWVDLVVTSSSTGSNALYHNDAGAGFSDSAVVAGVDAAGMDCHGCCWADYDMDGWPDLYIAVYGPNLLFHNEGNGTFTELATALGLDNPVNSEACSWADFDLDGDLDLFVLNNLSPNALYRNDGGGFVEVADGTLLAGQGQGTVAIWEDVDNDGDPDLFASLVTTEATTALYRNNSQGRFAEIGSAAGLRQTGSFNGAGWADYDNDGDPDLFLSNIVSGESDDLFRNGDSGDAIHHWIELDLVGVTSNRDGIGARVTLWRNGRAWVQEENGGLGFSQNGGTLHFGLGADTTVDSLVVVWPSGTVDRLDRWNADQRTTIVEGSTLLTIWPGDTDNDGDVDEEDVLPLVVYWHAEGVERSGGFAWQGQGGSIWDPESAVYADADGSGRVDVADLLPVGVNWGQTHVRGAAARTCRPRIEDHGPYLERYRALYDAVADVPSGTGLAAVRAYVGHLIVLAERSLVGPQDWLAACSPNPAGSGTEIRFTIARRGQVTMRVYDVTGRAVRTLVEKGLPAGEHTAFWDGRNAAGAKVAPGVYLVRMMRDDIAQVRKVVVVR